MELLTALSAAASSSSSSSVSNLLDDQSDASIDDPSDRDDGEQGDDAALRRRVATTSATALLSAEAATCRVLPYAVALLADPRPLVRQAAVRCAIVAFARGGRVEPNGAAANAGDSTNNTTTSTYATHLALDFALPRLLALGHDEQVRRRVVAQSTLTSLLRT